MEILKKSKGIWFTGCRTNFQQPKRHDLPVTSEVRKKTQKGVFKTQSAEMTASADCKKRIYAASRTALSAAPRISSGVNGLAR